MSESPLNPAAGPDKQPRQGGPSKLVIISAVVVLVVLAAIGIGVGVGVSRRNKNQVAITGTGTGTGTGTPSSPAGANITTDPRLKKVFWAIAYTPDYALTQFNCANTQSQVNRDISLMAQLTKRIRLYGADCNQTAMVLEAIKQNKADMEVFVGISIQENDEAAYTAQRDAIMDAIKTYGTDHIAGITVGNEFMLNYLTGHGGTDPNTSLGDQGAALLIAKINDTRTVLANQRFKKTIPVGNAEAGYYFNTKVMAAIDYGMANVHAWFASTTIADAAGWVVRYFNETNVAPASTLPNKPKMYIAETGWPTASSDPATAVNGGGTPASVSNLQIFIDGFVCRANEENIGYFFFEFIDEQWKEKQFGSVEGHWGLFDKDYNLKNITFPNCIAP